MEIDARARLLQAFLDARVEGSGAERYLCCDADARTRAEGRQRLYRYGMYDLVGYTVTERHRGGRSTNGQPYFIVVVVYENGFGSHFGKASDEAQEFIAVAKVDGALKISKWADEGTS